MCSINQRIWLSEPAIILLMVFIMSPKQKPRGPWTQSCQRRELSTRCWLLSLQSFNPNQFWSRTARIADDCRYADAACFTNSFLIEMVEELKSWMLGKITVEELLVAGVSRADITSFRLVYLMSWSSRMLMELEDLIKHCEWELSSLWSLVSISFSHSRGRFSRFC